MADARKRRSKKKLLMISAVAERFEIHPQTLRLYEREGLLKPKRSAGNTRLYDDESIRRLEIILNLTRELGVNLAGVEVVLHMREQMSRMQGELDRVLDFVQRELAERRSGGVQRRHALVKIPRGPLVRQDEE